MIELEKFKMDYILLFSIDEKFKYAKITRCIMRKGGANMILIILLSLIVLVLIAITIIVFTVGGALGIILFGDVIVCIVFLVWIIKKLIFRKK